MDKTGRNGIRVGDIELEDFKERYRALADKHEAMISFYDVNIQYNLDELKRIFESIEELKN
jgi:adenylosuccinate synthase